MSASHHELIKQYGKAQDAVQELSFVVAKMPMHFGACARDLKQGKPVSTENIEYQGALLKARASDALKAIGALHAVATVAFPITTDEQEKVA